MDASRYAMGEALSQLCKEDKWHPVGFTSKSLSHAERNCEIHDKRASISYLKPGRVEAHLGGTQT